MDNSLDKIHVIDSAALSGELYFESLLAEAQSKGLLRDNEIERLQFECINLLAYKTERYNAGDSSSIKVEKAQGIMISILFTIGVALKAYPHPDDAVSALQNESIEALYQKGRKRIDTLLSVTKLVYTKLLHQLIDTKNVFYQDTFVRAILGFFKLYNPDFAAQEIHITADYPMFNPTPKLAGIEFIKAYVEAAYNENQFCGYFAADDVHHLLSGYAEDYQGLLFNIYELVLTAAIGCIIAGTDCIGLDITEAGVQFLCRTFTDQSGSEMFATVKNAVDEINRRFHFSPELTRYMQNSLPLIVSKIEIAARQHTLNSIFFAPDFPENKPKIIFSFGDKMDDEQYRKIIEEIRQCRYSQDKLAIIREHIHSLADLEDVLLDADLSGEEIQNVLRELSLPEIAALYKKYRPMSDKGAFELREQEQLLRFSLKAYISALPQKHQDLIEQAGKAIQDETEGACL